MPRSAAKGLDAKRPRACDSCRGLKVKCVIDPSSTDPCKRCAKAGRQCVVTPPTRKRQKKADSRVAELERKLDALTATLAQRDGKAPPPPEGGHAMKRDLDSYESSPVQSRSADSASSPAKRPRLDKVRGSVDSDPNADLRYLQPIGREPIMAGSMDDPSLQKTPTGGSIYNEMVAMKYDHSYIDHRIDAIISNEDAESLFNRYMDEIVPHFPAVPFPPGTSAKQVRAEKPILFLAILSGTSYGANIPPDTQIALERELREVLATCMWKNGEKSLQLVQALQVRRHGYSEAV